ncbi:hypothetical protein L7F22_011271 [Adiantum nelumboides]|nr:hypothetical protein [Adiantum nelumboides]
MDGNKEEGSSSKDRQPIPTADEIGESSDQAEEALQVVTAVIMFKQLMEKSRMDGYKEEGSSSQDRQSNPTVHEVGEGSSQTEEVFHMQLVTDVTLFKQLMENSKFMEFLQSPLLAQQVQEHCLGEDIAVECETGKMFRANFTDRLGRPVIIMIPRNQNTNSHDGQLKQLVYTMEKATLYLPPDQEQFLWIIDFEGWSLSKASPLKTVRETANILQNHYPERLAIGVMLNAPKIFEYTWKAWKPFIDPTTYKKARFIYTSNRNSLKMVEDVFELESIDFDFKGKYNHSEYAKAMQADDLKTKLQGKHVERTNGVTPEDKE